MFSFKSTILVYKRKIKPNTNGVRKKKPKVILILKTLFKIFLSFSESCVFMVGIFKTKEKFKSMSKDLLSARGLALADPEIVKFYRKQSNTPRHVTNRYLYWKYMLRLD